MEANPCNNHSNVEFSVPAKVSRNTKPDDTIVSIEEIQVGGSEIVVIAGPCAVGSREQLFETAGAAVGADGLIIEVHYKPEEALCDGHQSLSLTEFAQMMTDLQKIARAIGRDI